MQDSDLFGIWQLQGVSEPFDLALLPDYRYLQIWRSLPGGENNPATGQIDHDGTWQIAWQEDRPYLLLTLAAASPPIDATNYGWQPALIGTRKVFALHHVEGDEMSWFGVTLIRVHDPAVSSATASTPPAGQLPPTRPTDVATATAAAAPSPAAAPAPSPAPAPAPAPVTASFNPNTIDWKAQHAQTDFMDKLVHAGVAATIESINKYTLPYPQPKPFPYYAPKPFSFTPPKRR